MGRTTEVTDKSRRRRTMGTPTGEKRTTEVTDKSRGHRDVGGEPQEDFMAKKKYFGWIILAVVVAGIVAAANIRSFTLLPFNGMAATFGAIVQAPADLPDDEVNGYTTGRILTIDITGAKPVPDRTFASLPAELRASAQSPSQVDTVVLMRRGVAAVGTYSNGASASKRWVKLYVVDVKTKAITSVKEFEGGEPPASISSNSVGIGDDVPEATIAAYISGLPRH
jgi:hypothetical protein